MFNILVFGTGSMYEKYSKQIKYNKININAFIENDERIIGKIKEGKPVISPLMINEYDYDYIVIMSSYWMQIEPQLIKIGVSRDEIIIPSPLSRVDKRLESDKRLLEKIKKLKTNTAKKKISVIVEGGDNRFIERFYSHWTKEFEVIEFRLDAFQCRIIMEDIIVNSDICFFEWARPSLAYATNLDVAQEKKIICRIHRFEVFGNVLDKVKWENVDQVVFIADHIREEFLRKVAFNKKRATIIYNGFDFNKFNYREREKGYNIAYLGTMIYRKAPNLMLQIIKKLVDKNPKYKLFLAGTMSDEEIETYMDYMIEEMGLKDNVIFDGFQKDIDNWLEDKDYVICTSVSEGHITAVQEAMVKGIKPIIHNYPGAKEVYDSYVLWNTIDEAVDMIVADDYFSGEYREIIREGFLLEKKASEFNNLFNSI